MVLTRRAGIGRPSVEEPPPEDEAAEEATLSCDALRVAADMAANGKIGKTRLYAVACVDVVLLDCKRH